MKAKLAGLALLMATSLAVHAHPGHHHGDTFAGPGNSQASPPANNHHNNGNDYHHPGGGTPGSTPPPIPEPETYAMLLAGLSLIAGIARRRRNNV